MALLPAKRQLAPPDTLFPMSQGVPVLKTAAEQAAYPRQGFADVLAFWQVVTMETRMASHVLMSELTRISAQQDQLKAAIAEAMSEADTTGEPFRISPLGLKSFKLHDKELEAQVDEDEEWEPSSPGIQAGWVEPDSTPQVCMLLLCKYSPVQPNEQASTVNMLGTASSIFFENNSIQHHCLPAHGNPWNPNHAVQKSWSQ